MVNFLTSTLIGDEHGAGLREQLVHAFLAGARHRLVGGDDDALDGGEIVQRLQRHDQLRRRAVRIGDDVLAREQRDRVRVHFRHDQRHVLVVAEGRRIIDDDAALLADLRRPFLGDVAAGRHDADVGVGKIILVERLDLQRAVAERHFRALAAPRGQRHHFAHRKAALFQYVEHFPAHIARGADDRNLETHQKSPVPLRSVFGENPPADAGFNPRAGPGRGWLGQGNQTVLVVRFGRWFCWNGETRRRARPNGLHCGQGSRMQEAPSKGRASKTIPFGAGFYAVCVKSQLRRAPRLPCTMAAARSTNGQNCSAGLALSARHVAPCRAQKTPNSERARCPISKLLFLRWQRRWKNAAIPS